MDQVNPDMKTNMDDQQKQALMFDQVDLRMVMERIGGPDTELGLDYGGKELSGGEWQKLALARALFRHSELIRDVDGQYKKIWDAQAQWHQEKVHVL